MCRDLPHVTVFLLGKFKGEIGVDHHLIIIASETISGLRPRWWLEKLVDVCESEGGGVLGLHLPLRTGGRHRR
jgi:hypothetical protein